jgi:hypothetical protein
MDKVNNEVLIREVMKMRECPLEEKERILDTLAEIMGYQCSSESQIVDEDELPNLTNEPNSVQPQETNSQIVDKNGKKVFQVSGNGKKLSIRGYKASLPRGSTVIRYRLSVNDVEEPVPGPGSHSNKFGHTKEKIVQKLQAYLGQGAQKAIQEFLQYDATFYQQQG